MDDRIKHRLSGERSKKSVNADTYLKVNLEGSEKLAPVGDINKVINVAEQFNKERQNSKTYRLNGTLRGLFSNPLFNISNDGDGHFNWSSFILDGSADSPPFRDRSFPSDNDADDVGDLRYNESVKAHLKELDGWFGYYDPDLAKTSLCEFFDMEPKRERFCFVPDKNGYKTSATSGPVKNWELTVTYPASIDDTHHLVNGGLNLLTKESVLVGGRVMIAFEVPINHNLDNGDTVRLSGISFSVDGDYTVERIGLDNGDSSSNYFCVNVDPLTLPLVLPTGSQSARMTKIYAGEPSQYYFRKFKKIKTLSTDLIENDDYEIYQLGFSKNIFGDKISQFVFNEDIDVSDVVDNLGRPLSELYLTMLKTDSNGLFTNVSSGIDMGFITGGFIQENTDIPHIRRIHNGGTTPTSLPFPSHEPLEGDVQITSDEFYGDVVEYNRFNVKEVILAEVSHRFNTNNREGDGVDEVTRGPRQEGYMYKAHHLVKIRDFSNYIEQGDSSVVGIPDYAEDLGDGRYLWRDLLDIGFNDGQLEPVDYPFLNGSHYIHQNYCMTMKRQDPFASYELYHINDPIGDAVGDRFIVKRSNDEC